jgi:DNA-binding XRE family transcriptional regulator
MNFLGRKKIKKENDFHFYLIKRSKSQAPKENCSEYGKQLEMSCHILKLRKQKKISQAELAKRVGLKQIEVIRIEEGKQNISISTLERIAKVFGCDLKISLTE